MSLICILYVFLSVQVRAVQLGRVLVVDEADKAPTNVTCVLKNIIGKGDVTLADGRRIVHSSKSLYCLLALSTGVPRVHLVNLAEAITEKLW